MPTSTRGATSPVGVILLVALVVVLGGTVLVFVSDYTNDLHEPSMVSISVEETTITDETGGTYISENGQNGCSNLDGHRELAVKVTLTTLKQADVIYVIVADEGGKQKKVLWDAPTGSDVGETLTLANEQTAMPGVDVDIGQPGVNNSGYALCPGEDATFRFYARNDGATQSLVRFEFTG